MICVRCGSGTPYRETGYCLHCEIGVASGLIDPNTHTIREGVAEGFPDWHEPSAADQREQGQPRLI